MTGFSAVCGLHAQNPISQLDSVSVYTFSGSDSTLFSRQEYRYNSAGQNVEMESYRRFVLWTMGGAEYLLYNRSYDEFGFLKLEQVSRKEAFQDAWGLWYKYEYQKNDEGLAVQRLDFHWRMDAEEWEFSGKMGYTYNDQGQILTTFRYYWNSTSNNWDQGEPISYNEYDENGRLTKQYSQTIDHDLLADIIKEYEYPTDTSTLIFNYKKLRQDSVYFLMTVEDQKFYPDGRIAKHYINRPNRETGELIAEEYFSWLYNESGKAIQKDARLWENSGWRLTTRSFFYYQSILRVPDSELDKGKNVFPNPSNGIVYLTGIDFPVRIQVYSITGARLLTESIAQGSLDLTGLSKGMYYLIIEAQGQVSVAQSIVIY